MNATQIEHLTTGTFSGVRKDGEVGAMTLDDLDPSDPFFTKILVQGTGDKTIHDVVLVEKKAAVKEGENYLSYLSRITLKYACNVPKGRLHEKVDKVAHLIVKEEPRSDGMTLEYVRDGNIFNNERAMLEEVVPKFEELVGKRLCPKVYYSSDAPNTIVMEDLAALGFKNKDRKVGLNENQVLMVLENIADFHAASVAVYEKDPGLVTRFSNGFFHDKTPHTFYTFIEKCLSSVADSVRDWPDKRFIAISDKLKKLSTEMHQRLLTTYPVDDDELKVLNHGDLWGNNLMFRDDENGEAQEARFVDFQICVWSSPAIDLLYFLSIVPEKSIKLSHDDIFLQRYLTRLSNTMKKLECSGNIPTLEQLKKSMHKRRQYALMAGITFYTKMIAEDDEIEGPDEILVTGESAIDPLKNPMARETIRKILPIWDERGYLE